jgi:endonuclease/exonuclease/phosphatase family metal-dependent hydrolase
LAVVCGDFNERRSDRVLSPFRNSQPALYDVAASAGDATPTWRGWSRLAFGRARLDYILADTRLELQRYALTDNAVAGRTLSDHRPVTVDLVG